MKRLLLFVLVMMTCVAGAEMISDGSGFDPGALRKSRFRYYGGATTEPSYTVILNHLISVDACCVNLWDNPDFEGYPVNYTFPATEVTLNNNATNYIVADYNGGTPIIKVITNVDLINESSVVPILTIYDAGGFLHTLNWDQLGEGLANKLHQRLVKTQRYQRESGLSMSMSNPGVDLTFEITEGRVWYGATREIIDAVDSTTDLTVLVEPNGNVIPRTTLNNTHYYNSGAYTELTANRYAVNWIYRGIENQKHCYIMLGDGDYKLDEAQSAQPPAAPAIITSHAQLIAKVIIQKDSLNVYSLQSAFDRVFATAGVTNHNDLTGLNEGDYQHLTAAELAEVQDIDSNYVATSALTLILSDYVLTTSLGNMAYEDTSDYVATSSLAAALLGYALLNGNVAEDFAADHLSANTASITTKLQVGATVDLDIAGDGLGNVTFNTQMATFTHNVHVTEQLSVGSTVDIEIIGDGAGNALFDYVDTATFANDVDIQGDLNVVGSFTINSVDVIGDINTALATILGE